MTLNVFALKADKSVMKENVIHKPLINHMISTLKYDTECLYSKSWTNNDPNNLKEWEIMP